MECWRFATSGGCTATTKNSDLTEKMPYSQLLSRHVYHEKGRAHSLASVVYTTFPYCPKSVSRLHKSREPTQDEPPNLGKNFDRALISRSVGRAKQRRAGLGWAGLGWAGLGWAGLGWAGLGWAEVGRAGLGWAGQRWAGLGWAGLGWAGLGWAGLGWAGQRWAGLGWAGLGRGGPGWAGQRWAGLGRGWGTKTASQDRAGQGRRGGQCNRNTYKRLGPWPHGHSGKQSGGPLRGNHADVAVTGRPPPHPSLRLAQIPSSTDATMFGW